MRLAWPLGQFRTFFPDPEVAPYTRQRLINPGALAHGVFVRKDFFTSLYMRHDLRLIHVHRYFLRLKLPTDPAGVREFLHDLREGGSLSRTGCPVHETAPTIPCGATIATRALH